MRTFRLHKRSRLIPNMLLAIILLSDLAGCSAIRGFPEDPEDSATSLQSTQYYFDPNLIINYENTMDSLLRQKIRDSIILGRVRAYDIEYAKFQNDLFAGSGGISSGGDLVVLTLNGLAATTGGLATKSALSAASAGVVGAQGAISKDLFYEKTVPVILAQIDANRTKVKLAILTNLNQSDNKYSLERGLLDLDELKQASGIPQAISNITQTATDQKQAAQADIDSLSNYKFAYSASGNRINMWLYSIDTSGKRSIIAANRKALKDWMMNDTLDPNLANIPFKDFLTNASLESDRQRAISDLHIPKDK